MSMLPTDLWCPRIMSAPVTPLCYLTINQPENSALIDYMLLDATHLPGL